MIFQGAILPYLNSLAHKLNKTVKMLMNNIEISEFKLRIPPLPPNNHYEAEVLIADKELCWHDTHTNYTPVSIIIVNTRSKAFVSLLCCGTLNLCPDIDYVDPRHTCTLRTTPQTCGTMVSLLPPFTMPRQTCIMVAGSIIVVYDKYSPRNIHRCPNYRSVTNRMDTDTFQIVLRMKFTALKFESDV
jgi:hypothetical protein